MKTARQQNESIFDFGAAMEALNRDMVKHDQRLLAAGATPYKAALQQIVAAYRLSQEHAPSQRIWTPLEAAIFNAQKILEADNA